jgi:hypothetical protein
MLDFFNAMDVARGISPADPITDNTPLVSQIVDLRDVHGAVFIFNAGSLADAAATFAVLVETGDDPALTDAAATPDDQLLGTEALAGFNQAADNKVFKVGLRGGYRNYGRVTVTPAGNASAAYIAGTWIRFPRMQPASNPPA